LAVPVLASFGMEWKPSLLMHPVSEFSASRVSLAYPVFSHADDRLPTFIDLDVLDANGM
jgi:hypothetical protein